LITEHPDPSVEAHARRGAMSPRNFFRVFVRKVEMASERFVERAQVVMDDFIYGEPQALR
jgi:hypothetical protein